MVLDIALNYCLIGTSSNHSHLGPIISSESVSVLDYSFYFLHHSGSLHIELRLCPPIVMNDFPKNKRAYVTEYGLFILIFSICAKFRTKEKGYSIFGSTKVISTMYCIHIFSTTRQCKNDL